MNICACAHVGMDMWAGTHIESIWHCADLLNIVQLMFEPLYIFCLNHQFWTHLPNLYAVSQCCLSDSAKQGYNHSSSFDNLCYKFITLCLAQNTYMSQNTSRGWPNVKWHFLLLSYMGLTKAENPFQHMLSWYYEQKCFSKHINYFSFYLVNICVRRQSNRLPEFPWSPHENELS